MLTQAVQGSIPTPTGRDIAVFPTDTQEIPRDGAFFNFGPDSTRELVDSLDGDCANLEDPKCLTSLNGIFGNDDNALVPRSLKQWFSLGKTMGTVRNVFLGSIAYLTMKWKASGVHLDDGQGLKLHLPSPALSAIKSASAATKVAYQTASNDPNAVTAAFSAKQTNTALQEESYSILEADIDGHHKGDIQLNAPSDEAANALNDLLAKGKCPAPTQKDGEKNEKRAPPTLDADCLTEQVRDILAGMEGNGPLGGFREQMMQLAPMQDPPNWVNEPLDEAWRQVLVLAGDAMPRQLGIRNEQVYPASRYVYLIAVTAITKGAFMVSKHLFIEAKNYLVEKGAVKCPRKESQWFPQCDNFVCQGKNGRCTTKFLMPCECNDNSRKDCPEKQKDRVCAWRSQSIPNYSFDDTDHIVDGMQGLQRQGWQVYHRRSKRLPVQRRTGRARRLYGS